MKQEWSGRLRRINPSGGKDSRRVNRGGGKWRERESGREEGEEERVSARNSEADTNLPQARLSAAKWGSLNCERLPVRSQFVFGCLWSM